MTPRPDPIMKYCHTHITQATPTQDWAVKYKRAGTALDGRRIALYGKQLLQGMIYLQAKQIPYGHLHAGNVLLDRGVCRSGFVPRWLHPSPQTDGV